MSNYKQVGIIMAKRLITGRPVDSSWYLLAVTVILVCINVYVYLALKVNVGNPEPGISSQALSPVQRKPKPGSKSKLQNQLCNIPTINPFDEKALELIYSEKPQKSPACLNQSLKFKTDLNSSLIRMNISSLFWETSNCCYSSFRTISDSIGWSKCFPISMNTADPVSLIPAHHVNINVTCVSNLNETKVVYQDYFSFFRRSRRREQILDKYIDLSETDRLSVIYLGIDSVSMSNFQRFLPKTHQFLLKELSAIEFTGLNKVGRGTIENLFPILTGCEIKLDDKVVFPKNGTEDCPPIWELFSSKGYRSVHSDEQHWFPLYNRMRRNKAAGGLRKHNTTYDNYPLIAGIQTGLASGIGCYQNQFAPNIIKDRIIEVATKYKETNKPYYHHAWTFMASHDNMVTAKYLDKPLHHLVTTLKQHQLLQNTLLIFNSDHGLITSKYSRTVEGLIEARQPLLYMVFPKWFKSKYASAFQNLVRNSKKLITPFDLHKTLRDVSSLKWLNDTGLNFSGISAERPDKLGISLFLPLPNRTCATAHIPEGYCICTSWDATQNPETNVNVTKAVSFALDHINNELSERTLGKCIKLDLWKIIDGKTTLVKESGLTLFNVRFQTIPGEGIFSAIILRSLSDIHDLNKLQIVGEIERQNAYGNQSHCVGNMGWLRSVCYCKYSADEVSA